MMIITAQNRQSLPIKFRRAITIVIVSLFSLLLFIGTSEVFLARFMGLGSPIIYDSSPLYGYRPLPSKVYSRYFGKTIKFNNLSLRSDVDWDENGENKILFLGDSVTYGGSYIDNSDLFSHLAVASLDDNYVSGNGGVNAWGVENIYGLVVESNFTPSQTYITVLLEGDFYRGLTRLQGLPFFNTEPKFALAELWYLFCYRQNNGRYQQWTNYADEETETFVLEKAVQKLQRMDTFLKEQGFKHLIFITPTRLQTTEGTKKNKLVHDLLKKYELPSHYIIDEINQMNFSEQEKHSWYHDDVHLTERGHQIWSDIMVPKLRQLLSGS